MDNKNSCGTGNSLLERKHHHSRQLDGREGEEAFAVKRKDKRRFFNGANGTGTRNLIIMTPLMVVQGIIFQPQFEGNDENDSSSPPRGGVWRGGLTGGPATRGEMLNCQVH